MTVTDTEIITIDGPTSSGKNSVGFLLAQKLGFRYIDSGMIYRAGCVKILKENVSPKDTEKVLDIYRNLNIKFDSAGNEWKMYLDDEDVTDKLHSPQISSLTYIIAAIPAVREVVRTIQRKITAGGKMIVGGRDIGSEIFPDAKYKFFLTASVAARSQRRFKQLSAEDPSVKYEDVLNDLKKRDEYDSTRVASPMRIPKDAIVIDSSNINIEETVYKMLEYIK